LNAGANQRKLGRELRLRKYRAWLAALGRIKNRN